jgi:hypothetical protein
MKNPIYILIYVTALFFSCHKSPKEVDLPTEVDFGKSKIYLNGELMDYLPIFTHNTIYNKMSYGFKQDKTTELILNVFAFGYYPLKTGDFQLSKIIDDGDKISTRFIQVINEDLTGYSYKLMNADEGFFNLESLDTINLTAKGRFRVEFCRTSKNGNDDLGLPKVLLYQGVFFDKYKPE